MMRHGKNRGRYILVGYTEATRRLQGGYTEATRKLHSGYTEVYERDTEGYERDTSKGHAWASGSKHGLVTELCSLDSWSLREADDGAA